MNFLLKKYAKVLSKEILPSYKNIGISLHQDWRTRQNLNKLLCIYFRVLLLWHFFSSFKVEAFLLFRNVYIKASSCDLLFLLLLRLYTENDLLNTVHCRLN